MLRMSVGLKMFISTRLGWNLVMALNKTALCRIGNLLLFVFVVIVNALGAALPLGDLPVGQGQESALLPATTAFSIWSLIYLLQLIFIVYQLFPSTYKLRYINEGISPLYGIQAVGNAGWIFAQAYAPKDKPWVQIIFMYLLLSSLACMYVRTNSIAKHDLSKGEGSSGRYYLNLFFGRVWLSLYLSWVVAAACVDSFHAFSDLSPEAYRNAAIVFAAIGLVALTVLAIVRDVVFGFGVVWTAAWLAVANSNEGSFNLFLSAVIVGAIVLACSIVTLFLNIFFCVKRHRQRRQPDELPVEEAHLQ